jgi:hypothetical protein
MHAFDVIVPIIFAICAAPFAIGACLLLPALLCGDRD